MNIGVILPELGGFSTISIEFLKWRSTMIDLGYNVYIITGKSLTVLPKLSVMHDLHPENNRNISFEQNMYTFNDSEKEKLINIETYSSRISTILLKWVESNNINVFIVENFLSIPFNVPVSIALEKLFDKITCKKIIKHHDAFYKNSIKKVTKSNFMKNIFTRCFPLKGKNIYHISTNRMIKTYLRDQCNINSSIIPYMINENKNNQKTSIKSIKLSSSFKLKITDKTLLNFSDLIPSANIEKLINIIKKIDDPEFKLILFTRINKLYPTYPETISKKIKKNKLTNRIIVIDFDFFNFNKHITLEGLLALAKGVISIDTGFGLGQSIHLGIENKSPLIFCTPSKLEWLEMGEIKCKTIPISQNLQDDDIDKIKYYMNINKNWGNENHTILKKFYSTNELNILLNKLFTKI